MKKKIPQTLWVKKTDIEGTNRSIFGYGSAKVWGFDLALDKRHWAEYKLVERKKRG